MAFVARRIARAAPTVIALALGCGVLVGCASPGRPPIADRSPVFAPRPEHYVVRLGDTLYSIAWRFELDFMGLARANGLHAPYIIYADQRIRLRVQVSHPATSPAPAPEAPRRAKLSWAWPVSAPVIRSYSTSSKGVDFRLSVGDKVRAAAAGEVVYAGNGLGRYAHLVIIKHSDHYLSAYSLNTVSRVHEGQRVKAGANLADISLRGHDALALHFEIRKDGKAVNPRALIGY